jgi:hypothetical protein
MTATDPRLAALTVAIYHVYHDYHVSRVKPGHVDTVACMCRELADAAAAILAALPPDWCGHEVDAVYRERNAVVAALIRTNDWPAWYIAAPDADGWFIVYAESDEGQVSWHIGPQDIDLFSGWMSAGARAGWDGWDRHTTEEKYRRIAALRESPEIATLRTKWDALGDWRDDHAATIARLRAALDGLVEVADRLLRTVHGEYCGSDFGVCRICADDRATIAAAGEADHE